MSHLRLAIEPIPVGSRLATLAKLMPRDQWDRLRRRVYRRARYRCQVCGREGRMYCHEIWQFNKQTGYQWLRGFQALCQDCHDVKHISFVRDSSKRERLIQHFLTVNRLTRDETDAYLRSARKRQWQLNQRNWIVNFGDYNLRMPSVANVQQRRTYARLNNPPYRC